jgi:hypothetical protein
LENELEQLSHRSSPTAEVLRKPSPELAGQPLKKHEVPEPISQCLIPRSRASETPVLDIDIIEVIKLEVVGKFFPIFVEFLDADMFGIIFEVWNLEV